MFRVLAICALLGLGVQGQPRDLPADYAQQLRLVGQTKKLLENNLDVKDLDVFKPELQYLVLLGAVYYPSKKVAGSCVGYNAKEEYLKSLANDLPQTLLKPYETNDEFKKVLSLLQDKLKPFTDLADKVCEGVSDYECNKLLQKLLESGNYPEAEELAYVLGLASKVAAVLLSKDLQLKNVAETLDVLPYLLGNVSDGAALVDDLSLLLRYVYPYLRKQC